jgi:L,D-transpeptidase YcbB
MRTFFVASTVFAILMGPALAQVSGQPRPPQAVPGKPQAVPVKPGTPGKPAAQSAKPAPAVASTPEARSAAELALTSDPVFDDGTYLRIKQTLLSYSDIQVRGGWPTLPADAKLAPGASGPEVALLRKRLVITEDMPANAESGDSYDAAVVAGVKKFQLRHGLDATGTVGAQTLKALNVPVGDRIKQLEA